MNEYFIGNKQLIVTDEKERISFSVIVQYPTYESSKPTSFGPYIMDVAIEAEIAEGKFPLIIVSHGTGGSPLLYRTISTFLARNGYVVAMIEHYGNNRTNNELEGENKNFTNRLRHITQTIDYLFSDNQFSKHFQKDSVAVIGHSIGANTAMVLVGGEPISYTNYLEKFGHTPHMAKEPEEMELIIDTRIKAVVLLALAPGWFTGDRSLENVRIPMLLFNAEKDDYISDSQTKLFFEIAKANPLINCQIVENAGHFSFLSPFPATIKDKVGLAAKDPNSFDREKFHMQLPKDILEFLNNKLNNS
jgi:predicted dienelactone hydrolase